MDKEADVVVTGDRMAFSQDFVDRLCKGMADAVPEIIERVKRREEAAWVARYGFIGYRPDLGRKDETG